MFVKDSRNFLKIREIFTKTRFIISRNNSRLASRIFYLTVVGVSERFQYIILMQLYSPGHYPHSPLRPVVRHGHEACNRNSFVPFLNNS